MEYIEYDGEKTNKIILLKGSMFVILPWVQDKVKIEKIHHLSMTGGKLETAENIIRYENKDLYIFDLHHNVLGRYKFSKKYLDFEDSYVSKYTTEGVRLCTFTLKKNYYIELCQNRDNTFYILNNGIKENILETVLLGLDKVYITNQKNKLQITPNKYRNNKWNGCPVSKINT